MSLSKDKLTSFLAILLVISFLLIRPGVLGQLYTTVGLMIIGVVVFFRVVFLDRNDIQKSDVWFFSTLTLFWMLLLLFGAVGDSNVDFLIKAVISNLFFVIILCFFVLSKREISRLVVKYYIYLLAVLGLSSAVSFILFLLGINVSKLELMDIEIGYENPSRLLFPFSILYHDMHSGMLNVLRFQSVFRESGIAQAFYIWGMVIAYYSDMKKWIIVGLLLGLLMAFSTSGIAIFFLVVSLVKLPGYLSGVTIKMRALVVGLGVALLPLLLALVGYAVAYIPYFGLLSKMETHSGSIDDRFPDISNLTFFGQGFYSSSEANAGINLIKASESIGIFLTILYVFIFTAMCWVGDNKKDGAKIFISISPFFITSLLSQPIVDAPLVFILLFLTRAVYWNDLSLFNKNGTCP